MQQNGRTDKSSQSIVPLDGVQARKVREAKKLTQLYVANVVGVTTDTISRWENNRYPAIKRENAQKLASALEVDLADILRQEEEPLQIEEPAPPPAARRAGIRVAIAALFILALVGLVLMRPAAPPVAERKLPAFAAPAAVIPVQIKVDRKKDSIQGFVVKERMPAGWRLVKASPLPAAGQALADEVKWLIPGGSGQAIISYTVAVSPQAAMHGDASFSGKIVVSHDGNNSTEEVGGDLKVKVAGNHWADGNGDGIIDDNEIMPAYYLTEEMKDFGLDWKTIEAIWSGKGYRWDQQARQFTVVK